MARMNGRTRKRLLRVLFERDGRRCRWTGVELDEDTACIDHIDNNNSNNELENLQLLSHSANTLKNGRGVGKFSAKRKRTLDDVGVRRRVSAELERNKESEPKFRLWVLEQVKKHKGIGGQDAIYGGAEVSGCNPETARRYLKKMASSAGMFVWDDDLDVIELREEYRDQLFPKKSVESTDVKVPAA